MEIFWIHRKLRILATEMFKVVKHISTEIRKAFYFYSQNNINLRQGPTFYSRRINSVNYSENSLASWGRKSGNWFPLK